MTNWTHDETRCLLDGLPVLQRSRQAIKERRRHLSRKLPGSGPRCHCGATAVARDLCHNHYEQRRVKAAAIGRLLGTSAAKHQVRA